MKLSVIIPVLNAEESIEKCVMSVVNQKIECLQIIIVDDYSKDDTYNICKTLRDSFPFIDVYQTIGKGVSDARNTGLKYADGDIIGFCDADDYFENNTFREIIKEFNRDTELDVCCCGYNRRSVEGRLLVEKRNKRRYVSSERMLERVLLDSRIMGSVWNKFYKKSTIGDTYFESTLSYCEDTAFNAQILLKNKSAKCLIKDICVYNYISNFSSVTNNKESLFNEDGMLKYNESMYYIRRMTVSSFQRRCVDCAIYRLSVLEYYNEPKDKRQQDILRSEIGRCFWKYLTEFFKFEPSENIKILIKGIIVILDGGTGKLYNFMNKILIKKRTIANTNAY